MLTFQASHMFLSLLPVSTHSTVTRARLLLAPASIRSSSIVSADLGCKALSLSDSSGNLLLNDAQVYGQQMSMKAWAAPALILKGLI